MFLDSSFMKTQFLLSKAMNAENLRWTVINNNIANADTPYFKRSDVTFESQLQRALEDKNPYAFEAKRSSEKHIPFHQSVDYKKVDPKIMLEFESSYRNDKNNVDIDKEMALAAQTQMRYNAYTTIAGRNFQKINLLLRG